MGCKHLNRERSQSMYLQLLTISVVFNVIWAQILFDGHEDIIEFITQTETIADVETPIYWSTSIVATSTLSTVSPTPTPDACQLSLQQCTCPEGYHCEFKHQRTSFVCPPLQCVPDCLKCNANALNCSCRSDQLCVFQPGSCFVCPFSYCLDTPSRCVECPIGPSECPCTDSSQCIYVPQSCDACAHYQCEASATCPPLSEQCKPSCPESQLCVVKGDINGCLSRQCVSKDCHDTAMLIDPCQFCTESEKCTVSNLDGTRKCEPNTVEPCLKCPPLELNKECKEHEHLIIDPHACYKCGQARCVPNRCINCFTFPIPIPCAKGEISVLIPPSCYDCGKFTCIKEGEPDPTDSACEGHLLITDIVNCSPITECKCVQCPLKASCAQVKCSNGEKCVVIEKTCNSCPKAKCVKELPLGCEPTDCIGKICPKNTQCVVKDLNGCPKAQCIDSEECLICPQVMPTCQCKDPSHCVFVKQTCLKCAHYKCVQPPICPEVKCLSDTCPVDYDCERSFDNPVTCPSIICKPKCKECPSLLPKCKGCERNQKCRITIGDCDECSKAECLKDPTCKECPLAQIKCDCHDNEVGVVDPGNCDTCPYCECQAKPCVKCPERDILKEDCSKCLKGERCEVKPRDCYHCERGDCLPLRCDPEDTICNCKDDEACDVLPGDIDTCPKAICKPKCTLVECRCGEEEMSVMKVEEVTGCPICKCVADPKKQCKSPTKRYPVRLTKNELVHVCVEPNDVRQCPMTLPPCLCQESKDCIYEPRTFFRCAEYKCSKKCVKCPTQAPACPCGDPNQCILQPRDCDHCARYYCRKDCVECPDEPEPCQCKDHNDCFLRPRSCLWCSHYECAPPSKRPL